MSFGTGKPSVSAPPATEDKAEVPWGAALVCISPSLRPPWPQAGCGDSLSGVRPREGQQQRSVLFTCSEKLLCIVLSDRLILLKIVKASLNQPYEKPAYEDCFWALHLCKGQSPSQSGGTVTLKYWQHSQAEKRHIDHW